MALNLSEQAQEQAIIQAFSIAGPDASEGVVTRQFWRLMKVLSPNSTLRQKLGQVADIKTVYGTVIGVDREVTSGRGIIYLKSAKAHEKWNKQGKEYARSDFLSTQAARDLMNQTKSLVGHRVAATILVLETDNGKVREFSLIEDLGADSAYDKSAPEYTIDHEYLGLDTSKLASHGAK